MTDEQTFPLDWNLWRAQWDEWRAAHLGRTEPISFGRKNLCADEILGVWRVGDRVVELSESRMPDFSVRSPALHDAYIRVVGLTFGTSDGAVSLDDAKVVHSFAELERVLGLS